MVDPSGFLIAWDGDELVGSCWTKVHGGGVGEIYVIGVSPPHQGRGLGRALVLAGLDYLAAVKGCTEGMLYVDAVIVLASVVVFRNLEAAPYAIIGIFAISRSVDAVLNGLDASKALMIISRRHQEIRDVILGGLDRGGTVLAGHGLFKPEEERRVIFTALSRRETVALQKRIRDIDPDAFCMVFDTAEVLGSGFKPWR